MGKQATRRPDNEREQDLVRLYLDEIGRHELLTKDDEVRLAQAIEAGRAARVELAVGGKFPRGRRPELLRAVDAGEAATQTFIPRRRSWLPRATWTRPRSTRSSGSRPTPGACPRRSGRTPTPSWVRSSPIPVPRRPSTRPPPLSWAGRSRRCWPS